jgi:hypothetical protein
MHDQLFDSSWLKLSRAGVHANALQAAVNSVGEGGTGNPTITTRAVYFPRRRGFAITIVAVDPLPASWALMLGDVAHNLRSALDNLAWALVTRGTSPPDALSRGRRTKVYFPLCRDRPTFNAALPTKLPGVRRSDIAIVRRAQPFRRGTRRGHYQALTVLADLNNADKHRTVQPIWGVPLDVEFEITAMRDCELIRNDNPATRTPLRVGAELAFVRVRKTGPSPYMDATPRIVAAPAVKDLVPLQEWLDRTVLFIRQLLLEFSEARLSGTS